MIMNKNQVERSMISPDYIDWFIKHYILKPEEIKEEWKEEKELTLFDFGIDTIGGN